MIFDIIRLRTTFISFFRIVFITAAAVLLMNDVRAQVPAPSPTATPIIEASPTPENPQPPVEGAQKVQPENLQGVPAVAPNYESNDLNLPELGRVGVDLMDQRPLTLREAITLALENNKDIEVTRQNVRISEFDLRAADGFYQPRFLAQTFYERSVTPTASFFGGGANGEITQSGLTSNVQLQGSEPRFGGNYQVLFNNSRVNSTNLFNTLNPLFTSNLSFQYAQPIFRGRRFDQNRRQIEIAKRNLSLTDTQFRQRSIEIIVNVQRAYWDLTYALRNLQVQRDGVKDAKDQLEHNRRLVEEGQLAPSDIIASETQVANFEQNVYAALDEVNRAENNLKNLIAENKSDALWSASIVPVDPVDLDAPNTTLPEALDAALSNRPELELNEVQRDINQIDQRFFREQTKPQIDLVATYNLAGLAGTANDAVNPFGNSNEQTVNTTNSLINQINQINGQIGRPDRLPPVVLPPTPAISGNLTGGNFSSITDIFANRYPTFRVGVQINLPFESRTARAQLGRSLVEGERIQTQRQQLEQSIQVEVRNALQSVRTSEARLRSAAISRENSERQYESEQRKLDAGQSDVYKVLERQTALTTARSNELRAQTELNKSIADLQRATGNSLKANNVEARLRK
jgi:HAE1 family hydrophobic/amphiphilic exporter-1